jgi:hypothetical protein
MRPRFKVITGIGAGAPIAPFAFIGSDFDPVTERNLYDNRAEEHFSEAPRC